VIGVPLAVAMALYVILEGLDFLWMASWPLRKAVEWVRGCGGHGNH
jgi:hypothetical protein